MINRILCCGISVLLWMSVGGILGANKEVVPMPPEKPVFSNDWWLCPLGKEISFIGSTSAGGYSGVCQMVPEGNDFPRELRFGLEDVQRIEVRNDTIGVFGNFTGYIHCQLNRHPGRIDSRLIIGKLSKGRFDGTITNYLSSGSIYVRTYSGGVPDGLQLEWGCEGGQLVFIGVATVSNGIPCGVFHRWDYRHGVYERIRQDGWIVEVQMPINKVNVTTNSLTSTLSTNSAQRLLRHNL